MYLNYIFLNVEKQAKIQLENICLLYEPFYVGKTKRGSNRINEHYLNAESRKGYKINYYFYKKINTVKSNVLLLNFTEDERVAYSNETGLIERIGSNHINEIINGPLTNICLNAVPPCHKGKTYDEIYGKEDAIIQRKNRSERQKERGGYGPKKHSSETKQKISKAVIEQCSKRDCSHKPLTKIKISKKAQERLKEYNPHWEEWVIVSPEGEIFVVKDGLKYFCKNKEISYNTLHRYFLDKKLPPSRGKTAGWYIKEKR